MNHIFVLSRKEFHDEVLNLTEQRFTAGAFISINDPDKPNILAERPNILNLWFDDAEEQLPLLNGEELILFNEEMARKVVDFVKVNEGAKFWMIHCTAGISRSGAVGDVLSEYFGIPYEQFKRTNPRVQPNTLVRKLLREKLFGELDKGLYLYGIIKT